jgi:hypothetical protein
MPECQNCGATVTARYARVLSPPDVEGVRACPACPDLVRDRGGRVREARSHRTGRHVESGEADVPAKGGEA